MCRDKGAKKMVSTNLYCGLPTSGASSRGTDFMLALKSAKETIPS
jgi:hypothetical protein